VPQGEEAEQPLEYAASAPLDVTSVDGDSPRGSGERETLGAADVSAGVGELSPTEELEAGGTLEETVPFVLNVSLYLDDLEDGLSFSDLRSSLRRTLYALKKSLRYMELTGAVGIIEQMEAEIDSFDPTEETISPVSITHLRGLLAQLHGYYPPDTFPEEEPTLPEPEATPTEEVSPAVTTLTRELQGVPGVTNAVVRALVEAGFRSTGQLAQADLDSLAALLGMDAATAEAILRSARRHLGALKKRLPASEPGKRSMLADVDDELLVAFEKIFGEAEDFLILDKAPAPTGVRAQPTVDLLEQLDAVAGETDQEIMEIFLSFGLEQSQKMMAVVKKVQAGSAEQADIRAFAEGIRSLRQSSSYMGYEKLATFLDQWYERTLDAADKLASLSPEQLSFLEDKVLQFQEFLKRLEVALRGTGDLGVMPLEPEVQLEAAQGPRATHLGKAQRVMEPRVAPARMSPGQQAVLDRPGAVPTGEFGPPEGARVPSPPPVPEMPAQLRGLDRAPEDVTMSRDPGRESPVVRTMRVDATKVDLLLNQVGELAVNRSFVEQLSSELRNFQRRIVASGEIGKKEIQSLKTIAVRVGEASLALGRAANDLQEGVMKLRMLPVGQLFNRMPRLIRDLSQRVNKAVSLQVQGGDTEVDKRIIEQIYNPLVHLIRNAVDHGIEDQEARRRQGKTAEGTILLNAYAQGNQVVIDVEDDGAGIDSAAVLDKAISSGLIDAREARNLSEEQMYEFLFAPGFSTSKKVTRTSDRGVGMDVVKRDVEKINGHVEVESSKGRGTRISIRIPLTLAIIQTLLVRHGTHFFAIPLTTVREIIRIEPQEISTIEGHQVIKFRDETIPILRTDEVFHLRGDFKSSEARFLVLAIAGYKTVGLLVQELVGEQDVVIKPLAEHVWKTKGLAGSTILGDGTIALVLDVAELVESVIAQQKILASRDIWQMQSGRRRGVNNVVET
jgi:two-component system chemotaxis sensor kinase CheA